MLLTKSTTSSTDQLRTWTAAGVHASAAQAKRHPIGNCCCCCDIKFDIPTGLTTLEESCGRSTGVLQPGAQWCYCCNRRVACMLTKAIVNYNAPVNNTNITSLLIRSTTVQRKIMLTSTSTSISPSGCLQKN
jgi:hypothetical protein